MDARESFKFGFMSRCIENGCTDVGEIQQLVKSALGLGPFSYLLGEGAGSAVDTAGKVIGKGLEYGVPALLAAPPILGYLGGRAAAKLTDADDFDVDDVKREELTNEYRNQTARLLQEAALRRARTSGTQSGRAFL